VGAKWSAAVGAVVRRVACCELAPRIGDLAGNLDRAAAAIESAVAEGAAIVVLPELATSGYVFESVEEAEAVAITADDPALRAWSDRAGDAVVVAGICERAGAVLHNTAVVLDRTGIRAVYRKTHLWDREKLFFQPGDEAPPVIDLPVGRIGVCICYDLEFPELTRRLALEGAELVAVPTNWPLVPRPDGERPPEVGIAMAAARVNRMAIAACDRRGTERGVPWTQGTTIIDQDGWPVASSSTAALVLADVILDRSRGKRLTDLADLHGDRRPELYGHDDAIAATTADRSKGPR
jgi:5-aminopentanamidase